MPAIISAQVIQRPVGVVFAAVADAGNYHRWNPTIAHARPLSAGEPGLGSTFEWTLRGFGRVMQEFGEFERNKRIRIVPHIKGLHGGHRFTFIAQGDATRLEHELVMSPTGWLRVISPVMGLMGRRNLQDTMRALQRFLEGQTPQID